MSTRSRSLVGRRALASVNGSAQQAPQSRRWHSRMSAIRGLFQKVSEDHSHDLSEIAFQTAIRASAAAVESGPCG